LTTERTNEAYYRALSSAADVVNRPGACAYFARNADDERDHARRVGDYLVDRGEVPAYDTLPVITAFNGNDYAGLFRAALTREQITTALLSALWLSADDESPDPQTVAFVTNPDGDFPGFLAEQTMSEREITDHLIKITRLSEDGLEVFDSGLK